MRHHNLVPVPIGGYEAVRRHFLMFRIRVRLDSYMVRSLQTQLNMRPVRAQVMLEHKIP